MANNVTLKATRKYPNIPQIDEDPRSHTRALRAIAESLEIANRRTKDLRSSFVTIGELVDIGLIDFRGNTDTLVGVDLSEIAELGDLSGAAEGDFLRFLSGEWVNGALLQNDITSIMVTQHEGDLTIAYSQLTGAPSIPTGPFVTELQELNDVDTLTPNSGDVLTFDGYLWVAQPPAAAGATQLDDLDDVETYIPSAGDILTWDGYLWTAMPNTGGVFPALDDITDVTITAPANGEVLTYSGGSWINQPASGGGGVTQLDDLTDVETYIPSAGDVLTWDGYLWTAQAPDDIRDPAAVFALVEDFLYLPGTTGQGGWDAFASGAGATITGVAEAGHPGIVRLTTGTATNGYAGVSRQLDAQTSTTAGIVPGGGVITIDVLFRINTLPVATTNEAFPRMGIMDEIQAAPTDGVYLTGGFDGSTFRMVLASRIAAVTNATVVGSGFAPTAGQWHHGRIVIDANATEVEGFIDGVSIGTLNVLPTNPMTPSAQFAKSNGTTSISTDIDLHVTKQVFSTLRYVAE